jgi:hypothetical protein
VDNGGRWRTVLVHLMMFFQKYGVYIDFCFFVQKKIGIERKYNFFLFIKNKTEHTHDFRNCFDSRP